MATFTFGRAVDIHWQGYEVVGPAGTVFSIPDQLYDEFNDDIAPVEPTLAWVDTNEFLTLSNSVSVTTLTGTIPISVTSTTSGKTVSISSSTNPAGYYLRADGTGATTWAALPADATGITNIIGTSPISAAVSGTTATISLNANYQTAGSYQTAGTYVTGVVGTSPISATGTTAITVSLNANYQTAGTYVNAVIGTSPASVSTASGTSTVSIVAGSIDSTHLSATSVGSSQLINGSVTSAKIGAGAVGSAALASGAVGSAAIAAASVGTAAISSGAATSGQVLQANGSGAVAFATPAAGGGMTLLATATPSAATTVSFTSISGDYDHLMLVWMACFQSSATEAFFVRINSDSSTAYNFSGVFANNGTFGANGQVANDTGFGQTAASVLAPIAKTATNGTDLTQTSNGQMMIYNYTNTGKRRATWQQISHGTATCWNSVQGIYNPTSGAAVTRIDFIRTSTQTLTGTIYLYGVS